MNRRCLIVGGYGTFGLNAAARLGRDPSIEIMLAGRDATRAAAAASELAQRVPATIASLALDATAPDYAALARLAPAVIVNASGPFQSQGYALAEAAIAVGSHYVDLADGRAFVTGITRLEAAAKAAGVAVVAGASSVPALSSAVIDHYLPDFSRLEGVRFGIVPANGFDPGVATTASILSYVGRPFTTLSDGQRRVIHGWQGIGRHTFPGIGARWLACCDIPDLDLLPERYPSLRTVDFRAGLEVAVQHFGLWGLSWLVRGGVLARPERLARPLLAMKRWMRRLGSDAGGMFVSLSGLDQAGRPLERRWHVIARRNHGPHIPPTPAIVIARRLLDGAPIAPGARPCLGLMSLEAFETEVADLAIEIVADGARAPVSRRQNA